GVRECRHERHHHHECKTLGAIELDGQCVREDHELDRRDNHQIGNQGDQTQPMPLAKFPGDCGGGGAHAYSSDAAAADIPTRATKISSREGTRPSTRCVSRISSSGALSTILPLLIIVT